QRVEVGGLGRRDRQVHLLAVSLLPGHAALGGGDQDGLRPGAGRGLPRAGQLTVLVAVSEQESHCRSAQVSHGDAPFSKRGVVEDSPAPWLDVGAGATLTRIVAARALSVRCGWSGTVPILLIPPARHRPVTG